MSAFNALGVYPVKSYSVNRVLHARRVGRKPEIEPSPFWKRLVWAWDRRGLPTSQNGVAKKLNMSQGSTARWYRGDGLPDTPQIIEIARLGHVNIHWLLTGDGPETIYPDADTAALLRHWTELPPDARQNVLRAAQGEHAIQVTSDTGVHRALAERPPKLHSAPTRTPDRRKPHG